MDFMKWLNSLDELLYEVVGWLVFFPLTLWRSVSRPVAMMIDAEAQLSLPPEQQFQASLRPPLFLALSLLCTHGLTVALGEPDRIVANRHGLAAMVSDDNSALILRVVVFAVIPLMMSARLVRRARLPFDRTTLRGPFYAQCYPTSALALGLSVSVALAEVAQPMVRSVAALLGGAAVIYFTVTQTRWFSARLGLKAGPALLAAVLGIIESFLVILLVGLLFAR